MAAAGSRGDLIHEIDEQTGGKQKISEDINDS